MKPLKCVHVTWIDSETSDGWENLSVIEDQMTLVHSVGFLIKETEDCVILAHSFDSINDEINGRIHIPICAIDEMRTLCSIKVKGSE